MRFIFAFLLIFAVVFTPEIQAATTEEINIPALVESIYIAEGGAKAKKPFGILSVPCNGYDECKKICSNTVRNNLIRWDKAGRPGEFIEFLADRYCPPSVDLRGNINWKRNVKSIYARKNHR